MRAGCVQRRTDKQLRSHLKLSLTSIECPPSADIRGMLCEITPQVESLAGARSSAGMDFIVLPVPWCSTRSLCLCGDCDGD